MALRHASLLLALAAIISLPGCATVQKSVSVTYLSDPPRASIYDAGHLVGQAPVTIKYIGHTYKHVLPGGRQCFPTRPVTARWESGAQRHDRFILACMDQGKNQAFVFRRPKNAPGKNVDQAFAAGDMNAVADAERQDAVELVQQEQAREARKRRAANIAGEVVEDALVVGLAVLGARYESPNELAAPASTPHRPVGAATAVAPVVTLIKPVPMTTAICTGSVVGSTVASVVMTCN